MPEKDITERQPEGSPKGGTEGMFGLKGSSSR